MTEESRLLRAVQAIAIDPADAHELVARHYAKARAAGVADDRGWVAERIVERYARLAATTGGLAGLAGAVPGAGQIVAAVGGGLADVAASLKLQVDMSMCLAATFGYDLTNEDARHLAYLIASGATIERAGEQAAVRVASKAGVKLLRQHLRGAALQAVKAFFRKLGITFTRKALEKAIPFGVGAVVGAAGNYTLTRYVGRQAAEWLRIDAELGGPQATLP